MEAKPATNNNDMRTGAPDSDSRSVEREGAQASARDIVKWGAIAAAPAPQASLTVSRQQSLRVAAKCGVCVVALLGFVVRPGLGLAQRGAGRGAEGCVR